MTKTILASVDFATDTDDVLRLACRTARAEGAALHFVYVGHVFGEKVRVDLGEGIRDLSPGVASNELRLRVLDAMKRLGLDATPALTVHLKSGSIGQAIIDLAAELDADLLFVGSHGRRGAKRWIIGSIAESIVRNAGCTVVVVRAKQHEQPES